MLTHPTTDRLRELGLADMDKALDHRAVHGLDRTLFQKLTSGEWIERHQDLLVTGPTGTGKTWLSCALGHRACRDNRSVLSSARDTHRYPAGIIGMPGWLRSESVAGFNRNRWLQSSECAMASTKTTRRPATGRLIG